MGSKVVVKKVRAFPIPVQFKTPSSAFNGQIVKLTMQGFLAEVPVTTLQPLEKMDCAFEFPVLQTQVAASVVVVKVYNQWNGSGAAPATSVPATGALAAAPAQPGAPQASNVVHLVELHFVALTQDARSRVATFLKQVQKHGL